MVSGWVRRGLEIPLPAHTDSAISDLIKRFFNQFKIGNSYKYVEMIDSFAIQSQVIEIDFNDLIDEIKKIIEEESKTRIHTAIYRAPGSYELRSNPESSRTRSSSTIAPAPKCED